MTHHLRTTLASATLLTFTLGLTGCSAHTATAPSALGNSARNSPGPQPASAPGDSAVNDEPTNSPETATDQWEPAPLPILSQIMLGDAPQGSGPAIALRFLRALQRSDDLAADHELYQMGRDLFAGHDLTFLHAVMNDVRTYAQLAHAGRCTYAQQLNVESAVGTCGSQHVVVHVLHDQWSSGVQIADWLTHHDVYRGPHSHAYTTIDPSKG